MKQLIWGYVHKPKHVYAKLPANFVILKVEMKIMAIVKDALRNKTRSKNFFSFVKRVKP